jgi:probable phosphoglycerate mutase
MGSDLDMRLLFVRHGATALNAAGLRCGGDVDLQLNDLGHRQAAQTARAVAHHPRPPGVIVASALHRARQSADLVARQFPGVELVIDAGFNERRLGLWNRRPIADTELALAAGETPPGGESRDEFEQRIRAAVMRTLRPLMPRRPLLVASKGVARVLGELTGAPPRTPLDNGEMVEFDLAALLAASLECIP